MVIVQWYGFLFGNAPHIIRCNTSKTDDRDDRYRTEAAHKQYFCQYNKVPFLSINCKKIFGATIPIPKHVEEVATTFESETYILNGIRFG